jgi:hypothetical protein
MIGMSHLLLDRAAAKGCSVSGNIHIAGMRCQSLQPPRPIEFFDGRMHFRTMRSMASACGTGG